MKLSKLIFISLSLVVLTGCVASTVPTIKYYHGNDSCGLACYSHNPQGIYKLSSKPYLEGLIMVQGKYDEHTCKPTGYENANIPKFNALCDAQISACEVAKRTTGKGCFADGDTGNLQVVVQ